MNSENIAVVKKEKVQEPWTPQNFIINLIVFEREIRRELKRREGDEEDEVYRCVCSCLHTINIMRLR